ncbi:hypothetical protein GIB67_025006, partial [Kingdonia uniflora]
ALPVILNFFLQNLLEFNDQPDLSHEDRDMLIEDLIRKIISIWQTDELRCHKPIPVDEARAGEACTLWSNPFGELCLIIYGVEGVQFMFDCVSGLSTSLDNYGCILVDDMGLGKTLQSITLMYTLLRQGFDGEPLVKKAIHT